MIEVLARLMKRETPQERNIRLAKNDRWREENCFRPPCHEPGGVGICPDCGEKELRHRAEGGATVILVCRSCEKGFYV
jgi:hypothetical protein